MQFKYWCHFHLWRNKRSSIRLKVRRQCRTSQDIRDRWLRQALERRTSSKRTWGPLVWEGGILTMRIAGLQDVDILARCKGRKQSPCQGTGFSGKGWLGWTWGFHAPFLPTPQRPLNDLDSRHYTTTYEPKGHFIGCNSWGYVGLSLGNLPWASTWGNDELLQDETMPRIKTVLSKSFLVGLKLIHVCYVYRFFVGCSRPAPHFKSFYIPSEQASKIIVWTCYSFG